MNLEQAFYTQRFEILFLRSRGDEFQSFFERLMSFAYKADFMACKPWGREGDHKNDGFLKSERTLFQVYAPNEMKQSFAVSKIKSDFTDAMKYFGVHFDKWVFVHNAWDGLPPHIQSLMLDFEKENPGVELKPWGLEELRSVFEKLNSEDLFLWFGAVPNDETKRNLGFKDLQVVLETIAGRPVPLILNVTDVPAGKLEANALSDNVHELLKTGMKKASLVRDFFEQWYDETLGERLAEAFRAKYLELRGKFTPNLIFDELQTWAGGNEHGLPEHQLAVLTILAYYFERCDIFEEPRE